MASYLAGELARRPWQSPCSRFRANAHTCKGHSPGRGKEVSKGTSYPRDDGFVISAAKSRTIRALNPKHFGQDLSTTGGLDQQRRSTFYHCFPCLTSSPPSSLTATPNLLPKTPTVSNVLHAKLGTLSSNATPMIPLQLFGHTGHFFSAPRPVLSRQQHNEVISSQNASHHQSGHSSKEQE